MYTIFWCVDSFRHKLLSEKSVHLISKPSNNVRLHSNFQRMYQILYIWYKSLVFGAKTIVEEPFWTESTLDISFMDKQVGTKFLSKLVRKEFKLLIYLTIGLHVLIISFMLAKF